jgi:hypothetical protein
MDAAVETYLASKPNLSGFLCIDQNGLVLAGKMMTGFVCKTIPELTSLHHVCSAGKGDVDKSTSGRYTSLAREAAKMHPGLQAPKITIETGKANILVKSYDSVTIVVKSKAT